MNSPNDNFSTPKQTKRLGLKRSSSILRDSSAKKSTLSLVKDKSTEMPAPSSTPRRRWPQSDLKVSYKHLEVSEELNKSKHADSVIGTPTSCSSMELQRQAVSTNCRPYRLALSKRVREKMTKKRLEFYMANEMEKEESKEEEGNNNVEEKKTGQGRLLESEIEISNSKEQLLQKIEVAQKELTSRLEHEKKVKDLQEAINVWKAGFSSALKELQQKLDVRLETETLLELLHIPPEMIKYIND